MQVSNRRDEGSEAGVGHVEVKRLNSPGRVGLAEDKTESCDVGGSTRACRASVGGCFFAVVRVTVLLAARAGRDRKPLAGEGRRGCNPRVTQPRPFEPYEYVPPVTCSVSTSRSVTKSSDPVVMPPSPFVVKLPAIDTGMSSKSEPAITNANGAVSAASFPRGVGLGAHAAAAAAAIMMVMLGESAVALLWSVTVKT